MIGAGVGAAGTSLLALLADARRAASGGRRRPSITWIMMIVGIVVSAAVSRARCCSRSPPSGWRWWPRASPASPFSSRSSPSGARSATRPVSRARGAARPRPSRPSGKVLAEIWADPLARRFTVFVFVSMLAYSAQELILEPFAGLVFEHDARPVDAAVRPSARRRAAGHDPGGRARRRASATGRALWMRRWTIAGCLGSARRPWAGSRRPASSGPHGRWRPPCSCSASPTASSRSPRSAR